MTTPTEARLERATQLTRELRAELHLLRDELDALTTELATRTEGDEQ